MVDVFYCWKRPHLICPAQCQPLAPRECIHDGKQPIFGARLASPGADLLRAKMAEHGWSQDDVAAILETSRTSVYQWLRGARPHPSMRAMIEQRLQIPAAAFKLRRRDLPVQHGQAGSGPHADQQPAGDPYGENTE